MSIFNLKKNMGGNFVEMVIITTESFPQKVNIIVNYVNIVVSESFSGGKE